MKCLNGDHFTIFEKRAWSHNIRLIVIVISTYVFDTFLLCILDDTCCHLFVHCFHGKHGRMWPGSSLKKRVKNVSTSFLMAVQAIDFSLTNIILIPIYFYEKRLQWNIIL